MQEKGCKLPLQRRRRRSGSGSSSRLPVVVRRPVEEDVRMKAMLLPLLLLAASSAPTDDVPPETVQAFVGDDVVLPCSYLVPPSKEFPTLEWSKDGLQPDVVFLYRDGCEVAQEKNVAFKYRTSLVTEDLTSGTLSLRIGSVRLSDAGTYRCMRLWDDRRNVTEVQLVVGAASETRKVEDEGGSCLGTGLLSAGIPLGFLLLALFVAAFCWWWRIRTSAPDKGLASCSSEGRSLLPSSRRAEAESERNAILEAEVKELRSKVTAQEAVIRQLQNNNMSSGGARLDAVVCHSDQTARPESQDAPERRHSSLPCLARPRPAPHAAPSLPTPGRRGRSLSESCARPRCHSVAFPSLPRVAEESEMLIP